MSVVPFAQPTDQRSSARRRVILGGIIINADGTQTWDCTVRNISDVGALIRLASDQAIPTHCLLVNLRDAVAHDVTVEWMRPPNFGLKFLESHKLENQSRPNLQLAQRLWMQRRGR